MKTLKRVVSGTSAAVLTLSSLLTMGFSGVAHATSGSDTCTWTGATNSNFSTSTNWSGCSSAAPVSGDNLIFDATNLSASATLNNNISSLSVGSITFQGTNSGFQGYTITGSALTVTTGIAVNGSASGTLAADITLGGNVTVSGASGSNLNFVASGSDETINLNGHNLNVTLTQTSISKVAGSGNITFSGGAFSYFGGSTPSTWSGVLSVTGTGSNVALESATALGSASLNIGNGSDAVLCGFNGATVSNALTVTGRGTDYGDGTFSGALLLAPACGMGGGSGFQSAASAVWGGPITLAGNSSVGGSGQLKVTGALSGNYTLTMEPGQAGNLDIESSSNQSGSGNGAQSSQVVTTTYSSNSPNTSLSIGANTIGIVDGTYGDASVGSGGILKGTGSIHSLQALQGGTVAPGHSPGKLTIVTTLTMDPGSTYQAELKDTAAGDFDQIVVGSASDTTGNDVTLGTGSTLPTLDAELYAGASIKAGDQFKIIDNLSKTAVSGTFANLPEGATFKVGSGVFKISYVGGDGNDVVLTAQTAATAPNTGFALMSAHPGVTLGLTALSAGAIFGVARRMNRKVAPARAKVGKRR